MTIQRPPSDDLQKGEHDLYTQPFVPVRKIDLEKPQDSVPPTFEVWWVDDEGNDRKDKIGAETNSRAIEIVKSFANCLYVISCIKSGILKGGL